MERLEVDLARRTGAVFHGASGALYGLSDDGVPSDNTLAPLRVRTINQKAPGGLQHPNGDALVVAEPFFRTGGAEVHIYLQDVYPAWPYDNLGLDDYASHVDRLVRLVMAHPSPDRFVYVPFNEPDLNWYQLRADDGTEWERFFADWARIHRLIRSIHPGARIAGPNESAYDAGFLRAFLTWTAAENVLPDVLTWHELSAASLRDYRGNHAGYRQIEREVGVGPLPINVNEYGNRRDMSVPGQLVQWVAMFEDTKVDANLPYWDIATNYDSHVVQTNQANGGWWLLKWYGDLSGDTVAVTPPRPNTVDTLQGLAAVDDARRQAHVLLGGTAAPVEVVVSGVTAPLFAEQVRARVEKITWSGYDAAAPPPAPVADEVLPVTGGRVTVSVPGGDPMAAYRVVLSPPAPDLAVSPSWPPSPLWSSLWSASYEAEDASIVDGPVRTLGTPDDANQYAASGTRDVGPLDQDTSAVTLSVDVPHEGAYRLGILYGNQSGGPAQQALRVDGRLVRIVDYPETLNWAYRARRDVTVPLGAGAHEITLAASDPSTGRLAGAVTLDRLDLTAAPDQPRTDIYPADLATRRADAVEFVVVAAEDGYHDLAPRSGGRLQLRLGGIDVPDGVVPADGTARVYLPAGINRVAFVGGAPLAALAVTRVPAADVAVRTIEAEDPANTLSGGAAVRARDTASGGACVGGLGRGGALTVRVTVDAPGVYQLAVHYANNERSGGHEYNANLVSRAADITTTGGTHVRVWYRNTYSWHTFWSLVTPVHLLAGENEITFTNPDAPGPDIDKLAIAPLLL
ncbi:CBM35 domain-containing protein [Actinomycetes bacterium KLBMP 9797]